MQRIFLLLPLAMAACSTPSGPSPSLAPRAAETIDPRVPIPDSPPVGEVDPVLRARLARLLDEVRAGDRAFVASMDEASRLAAAADGPASESWIAAQQALSALVAARGGTTQALSDIDAIAAERLRTTGGISPANLAAIEAVATEAGALDQRQATAIELLQARLGS